MLDFILGLLIGNGNPDRCFTNKKYNKYLKEREQIKREAFRRQEEEERKKKEELMKRTCSIPSYYCDENKFNILRWVFVCEVTAVGLKEILEKKSNYYFEVTVVLGEVGKFSLHEEKRILKTNSLTEAVEKFIELCNSDEHYYWVLLSATIRQHMMMQKSNVLIWMEERRIPALINSEYFLSEMWKWEENKKKEKDKNDGCN